MGEDHVLADAEVLAVAIDGLRELGLRSEDFRARVSDRRLLTALLTATGVPSERAQAAFPIIDKLEREPRAKSLGRLEREVGLPPRGARELLELFEGPGLEAVSARYGEREEVAVELGRLREYEEALGAMGLGPYVEVDLTIVRGLAYYTGIVFELFDRRGELRAICGGGRYDRLLELVGGDALPAVGFGMGDVVLAELLDARGLAPDAGRSVDHFIVTIGPEQRPLAFELGHKLRERGLSVLYALSQKGVKKQFSQAATVGAREVIVLGPDEVNRGVAMVREMSSGREREVALGDSTGGRRVTRDDARASEEVRAVAEQAVRRLNVLEYVILAVAALLAVLARRGRGLPARGRAGALLPSDLGGSLTRPVRRARCCGLPA